MTWNNEYQNWRSQPQEFWMGKAQTLSWYQAPTKALSMDNDGLHHWFADGKMNTCFMALDHHVEQGRSEQTALIYDSPVSNKKQKYSYKELTDKTAQVAGMLSALGVQKGDTVLIYMPMIPEAAMAMLACARIGAIHSVVFGGFAAAELASRIDDAKPKLILSASCGIEINRIIEYKPLLDEALRLANHQSQNNIIFQREEHTVDLNQGVDLDWMQCFSAAEKVPPIELRGDDPLYILYTSGTTGSPKGIVRENGGHAVALKYSMSAIYNMQAGDTFWSASDIGWVVGHSYIVYGPLLAGCATVFYEGKPIKTPDAGAFWRVIEEYKVNALFSAPTAFRAIRCEDPEANLINDYDISSLRQVFAAGERLDPATQEWMTEKIGVDVIDNWWQTETGWPIVANMTGIEKLPIKLGSASKPVPGYDIKIFDNEGNELSAGQQGNIAIKLPLPPGCMTTIWGDNQRFKDNYLSDYKGYYTSGDHGCFDEDGYLFIMGRIDDVINVSGHRLSTGDLEEVISQHDKVAECAVVARNDDLKGEIPVGFIVLKSDSLDSEQSGIGSELTALVREKVGALACYKTSYVLENLPKTRSGKILRKTLKQILNQEKVQVPATIENAAVLDEVKSALSPKAHF